MLIPKDIQEKWSALRSKGDSQKIVDSCADRLQVTVRAVNYALRNGECSDELFEAIAAYYEAKAAMIAKYMPAKPVAA